MRTGSSSLFVLVGLTFLAAACRPNYDIPVSALPASLQPIPGAKDVEAKGDGRTFGVSYVLNAPYPAAEVLTAIKRQIPAEWTPRTESYLNPGIPTSHVRGWSSYGDLTTKPSSWAYQWMSEWEDRDGDILTYTLVYRSPGPISVAADPPPAPKYSELQIMGDLTPSWDAKRLKEFANRQR
jgi:hypothetical protein